MQAALREARDRGADTMEIAVDEPDLAARRLYESLGFTNRAGDGSLMFVYERDLQGSCRYLKMAPPSAARCQQAPHG